MSVHLLAAAVEVDDSNTMSDCEAATRDRKDETLLHEAMSHTATEGMHVAMNEAISHRMRRVDWGRACCCKTQISTRALGSHDGP